jgi:Ca-activated chloride channel family protein
MGLALGVYQSDYDAYLPTDRDGDAPRQAAPQAGINGDQIYYWDGNGYSVGTPAPTVRTADGFCTFVTNGRLFARGRAVLSDSPPARPRLSEEVWVIVKAEVEVPAPAPDDLPRTGALMAVLPGEPRQIPVPLKHTDVKASIAGYIATVDVTQQYENPFDAKIEAVYVFPLPENAAVNEFLMTVGDRTIRGIIRERQEAEKIYKEARDQGYVASLMTQERPNVFTQKVANIEPGKAIDISVKYYHTLTYADGWYEFVFPMVVGPRYNPAGFKDGIGPNARGHYGASGQKTGVQYLAPDERSGHDISVAVDVDAGCAIEEIQSRSHVVTTAAQSPTRTTVTLNALDTIPNKDFVLRYKVAGKTVKEALVTHKDERGGFFSLMLYPPESVLTLGRQPLELVFVMDVSGSMNGEPVARSKAAVERALLSLQPGDTFQIVPFANNTTLFSEKPLVATPENVKKGVDYVRTLEGGGGTEMTKGIRAALSFPSDPERLRFIVFLTDGFVGNEFEVLKEVRTLLGASRIFSFGIGSSTNRFLLDGLAVEGRGAVAYIGMRDTASDVMDLFFERISHAALTDISIDWGGMKVRDVYPAKLPDLFVGRPVVITGRFDGEGPKEINVKGRVAGRAVSVPISANSASGSTNKALPAVWARLKIADLSDRGIFASETDVVGEARQTALEYGLMSAWTAFVAVDSLTQTAASEATTVQVAVPVPEGVKYETTVTE